MIIYQIVSDHRVLALFVKKSNARKWLLDKRKSLGNRISSVEELPDSLYFDPGGFSSRPTKFSIFEIKTEDDPDFIINED